MILYRDTYRRKVFAMPTYFL